ncbi:MAG: HPr family phosphocarrier protein [Oscillospiraceae bacterium]
MKQFQYVITDEAGIHARPAGVIYNLAKGFESSVTLGKNGRTVSAGSLIGVMSLGIKAGDTVTVSAGGSDEDEAIAAYREYFENNL